MSPSGPRRRPSPATLVTPDDPLPLPGRTRPVPDCPAR